MRDVQVVTEAPRRDLGIGRIELMPMLDEVLFRNGVSREDGYRRLFAVGCDCPPSEIVDVRFGEKAGYPVVFAAWEFSLND